MSKPKLIPHLFRTEFSKIVSVLCKTYGIANIQIAEDIASDTFLAATETWSLKGIPEYPKAWLYAVAKNKTKDHFKRKAIYTDKIVPSLNQDEEQVEILDLSEQHIEDSQLQMIFTVCNPILSTEAQISLALRILCGFGISEIATALLTTKSTINKRLSRAKANYKKHQIQVQLPQAAELIARQENVLRIIYLIFNEGYYSYTKEKNIRKDLCLEAMRLLYLFLKHNNIPQANALMALFCFHASRFEARSDELGNPILYKNQDSSKWDKALIGKGEHYLQQSAAGSTISKYHLEATIAFWHSKVSTSNKWEQILQLYNHLLQIEYSPIAALNRTYALAQANGKAVAIQEALKIDLKDNHLYHALLAELYSDSNTLLVQEHLEQAIHLAKTASEKAILQEKLDKSKRKSDS